MPSSTADGTSAATMNPLAEDLDHVLAHTEGLWDELRGQKIFITGATGFFGCWLLESFSWANEKLKLKAQAVALTRNLENFQKKAPHLAANPAIRFQIGDVRDFKFSGEKFAFIIHAATEASAKLNLENPTVMLETIVEGTRRALDFAVKCGAKKFLLTSSGAVYGPQPPELTHTPEDYQTWNIEHQASNTEHRTPKLDSAYAEGKRLAELLGTSYAKQHTIEIKIARCFAFVGPYLPLDSHFAIGNFIRDGLRGGPIQINGDGTPYRSYLYAADLTIWLWTILFRGKSCRPYNVGSANDFPVSEIANSVNRAFENKLTIRIAQQPVPGKPPERYVPSTQRAEAELGLRETTELRTSIVKTSDWECRSAGP
ncbi:MAG: NAD-dependent epimerase/dehydratase family protein [Verrucomicrobiota bacterium]